MSPTSRLEMKGKAKKKHPWADLARLSSFTIAQLSVLHEHHVTLHRFCIDPEKAEPSLEKAVESESDPNAMAPAIELPTDCVSESSLHMNFEQYVTSVRALITYGSSPQQFEYLFQTYAISSERGISRGELFQLLQDHYKSNGAVSQQSIESSKVSATETRHFERLYTWLKKHFNVYDRTRCGYLSLHATLEMLQIHPDALYHLQLQVDPFIQKLSENNKHYEAKAQAAAIK